MGKQQAIPELGHEPGRLGQWPGAVCCLGKQFHGRIQFSFMTWVGVF